MTYPIILIKLELFLSIISQTRLFPATFSYRKSICIGTSSKPLQDVLLDIDENLLSEDELQQLQEQYNRFLDDVKLELEDRMITTTFSSFFVGSVAEIFGIPKRKKKKVPYTVDALLCDVDVMLCCDTFEASFSGQGNIHIEELETNRTDSSAYHQVNFQGQNYLHQKLIKPKLILDNVKDAVLCSKVTNLPGRAIWACCYIPVHVDIKGPTIKFIVGFNNFMSSVITQIEGDITLCIKCLDWPPLSDWPTRERLWPSADNVQKIITNGIHLVAKPLSQDGGPDLPSWRLSFSLAEVELSTLLPDTARNCFMALKIIFKDHLQTVLPKLSSYHMKTIFLNTLEKKPESFWVDEDIEECFQTLLEELHSALESGTCYHYWLGSNVNLFDFEKKSDKKKLSILARKVKKIQANPAPYINDDSCCCVCLCCLANTDLESGQRVLVNSPTEDSEEDEPLLMLTDIA